MKTLWVLFLCVLGLSGTAQVAPKCEDNFKVFEGRYLAKEYNDAYVLLKDLRVKCPKVNENLYVYAEGVLVYRIEIAQTPEEKKAAVEELVAVYTEQNSNFPNTGAANVKKTQLQFENKLITKEQAYKAFSSSFENNRQNFTDYNALHNYFEMVLEDFKSGKGITDEQYFQKYGDITTQIAHAKNEILDRKNVLLKKKETSSLTDAERQFVADAPSAVNALENVADVIQKQSRDYISCEKMEEYYEKNYETHKKDISWLEGMTNAMYSKKCYRSAVLLKGELELHGIKPTKETSYRIAVLNLKKTDNKEAFKYFDQAISLETSQARKSDLYIQMATAAEHTDKSESKKYLLKAIELNPKAGDAYLQLAQMYASVQSNDDCKLTNFDKKVLNYLAIETAQKAGVAEPKYNGAVSAVIARYEKNKPTKEEAKALGKKKGDKITFGCWINETVTLPNL